MTGGPLKPIFLVTVQDLPEKQYQKSLVTWTGWKQHDFLRIEGVDWVSHGHLPLEGGVFIPFIGLSLKGGFI